MTPRNGFAGWSVMKGAMGKAAHGPSLAIVGALVAFATSCSDTPPAGAGAGGMSSASGAGGSASLGGSVMAGASGALHTAGASSGGAPSSGGKASGGSGGSGGVATQRETFYVDGSTLRDPCGEAVVLRGANHPTIYVDRAGAAIPEIASTGANAVRLVWFATHGVAINEAEAAIQRSIDNHLVPILEMHDSTCTWDIAPIVDYWTSAATVALVNKFKGHLLVNLANEASTDDADAYERDYKAAIATIRGAGIKAPIVLDAPRCGRDHEVLLARAPSLLAADPERNMIFSAHLYDPMSQQSVGALMDKAVASSLAFIIGEFANKEPPGCGAALSYSGILAEAERTKTGWLAWSWGDNNDGTAWNTDCAEFDMTSNFSAASLQGWGKEVAESDPNSIKNTSHRSAYLMNGACQ